MNNVSVLELIRVKISDDDIYNSGKASIFFDVYPNNQNITEELLYAHQPVTNHKVPIYATSPIAIGKLDYKITIKMDFTIIKGPAIIIARKGYAGRLFVVEDTEFIVHEDAYPIKPKSEFIENINLHWFANHYNEEFQANRTSTWGIGDFPRTRFSNMNITIPKIDVQNYIAELYIRRKNQIDLIKEFENNVFNEMDKNILRIIKN